jgi:hypothetical protein
LNYLSIDKESGQLRANHIFDYEDIKEYTFDVIASDNNNDNKTHSTRIKCHLHINDINDNIPNIVYNSSDIPYLSSGSGNGVGDGINNNIKFGELHLRVDENIPLRTQLAKFQCKDADSVETGNGKVYFKLIESSMTKKNEIEMTKTATNSDQFFTQDQLNKDSLPFYLTSDGRLLVSNRLDREYIDKYDMFIMCLDSPRNNAELPLNSSVRLIIHLNDINDNCPKLIETNSNQINNQTTPLKRSLFINKHKPDTLIQLKDSKFHNFEPLFQSKYNDVDIGVNGELKFELISHTDTFSLNIINERDANSHGSFYYTLKIYPKMEKKLSSSLNDTKLKELELKMEARDVISQLKMGKYAIKVKISDLGYPSCIKNELFILYVGQRGVESQAAVIDKLKSLEKINTKNEMESKNDFINDKDELSQLNEYDQFDEIFRDSIKSFKDQQAAAIVKKSSVLSSSSSQKPPSNFFNFNKKDYFILFCLLAVLILISIVLSIIIAFYCFKKYKKSSNDNDNKTSHKLSNSLRVYNEPRGINNSTINERNNLLEPSSSSSSSSSSNDGDGGVNRLSMSLKSNDQSNSAESVLTSFGHEIPTGPSSSSSSASSTTSSSFSKNKNSKTVVLNSSIQLYDGNCGAIYSNGNPFNSNNNNNNNKNVHFNTYSNQIVNNNNNTKSILNNNNNTNKVNKLINKPIFLRGIVLLVN